MPGTGTVMATGAQSWPTCLPMSQQLLLPADLSPSPATRYCPNPNNCKDVDNASPTKPARASISRPSHTTEGRLHEQSQSRRQQGFRAESTLHRTWADATHGIPGTHWETWPSFFQAPETANIYQMSTGPRSCVLCPHGAPKRQILTVSPTL
jgi:hypothetical protein